MKILITGAAGGIGSMLCIHLMNKNIDLILVDNFRNNFVNDIPNIINLDIRSKEFIDLVKKNKPDIVIHLAAVSSLPDCEINKQECIDINVCGTVNVLEACRISNVSKIIFASTSAVYENNSHEKSFSENLQCTPRLFYSSSKKMAEDVCLSYIDNYDMNICILRFFNVLGPNQDFLRISPPLLNYLVYEIYNNRIPKIHSNGNQSRDYITVFDLINLFDNLINAIKLPNMIMNVCSGKTISVNELIEFVKSVLNSNIEIEYKDANKLWDRYENLWIGNKPLKKSCVEKETNKYCLGDNSTIYQKLNWKPNENLTDDIKKIILMIVKKIDEYQIQSNSR